MVELRFDVERLAVERLAELFFAPARFVADLAELRLADDFFAAPREADLRAPPERLLERERFEDAFFAAAIGTPPELEWRCA